MPKATRSLRRIDPVDGVAYTLKQFESFYRGWYSRKSVLFYFQCCAPAQAAPKKVWRPVTEKRPRTFSTTSTEEPAKEMNDEADEAKTAVTMKADDTLVEAESSCECAHASLQQEELRWSLLAYRYGYGKAMY